MAKSTVDGRIAFSKQVTLVSYANELFEPRAFQGTTNLKYGAQFLIPVAETGLIETVKAKAAEVARARWPGRSLGELAWPFANGDKLYQDKQAKITASGESEPEINKFYCGHLIVRARSKFAPTLSALENGQIVEYDGQRRPLLKDRLYSGCFVVPQLNFVAYDGVGANPDGVTAYLDQLLWFGDGDKIMSAGKPPTEVFKHYQGRMSDENPMGEEEEFGAGAAGAPDEIPF